MSDENIQLFDWSNINKWCLTNMASVKTFFQLLNAQNKKFQQQRFIKSKSGEKIMSLKQFIVMVKKQYQQGGC